MVGLGEGKVYHYKSPTQQSSWTYLSAKEQHRLSTLGAMCNGIPSPSTTDNGSLGTAPGGEGKGRKEDGMRVQPFS